MLIYGTDSGCVNVFTFNNDKMFTAGVRKNHESDTIFIEKETPNKTIRSWGSLWKRKAHEDWTLKTKYLPDLRAIVSCSPDPHNSLVIAVLDYNHKWQIRGTAIHRGVNVFAYCRFPVTIITGGIGNPSNAALKGTY